MDQENRIVKPNQIVKLNDGKAIIKIVQRNGGVIDFLIDSEDIPLVGWYKWFSHMGYCSRIRNKRQWPLSWELFGKPPRGYLYHHLNGDRKNYRRENLCLLTWSANNLLKKGRENRSTGMRGISRYADGSFVAIIGAGNKRKSFKTLEDAIEARKQFESTMMKAIHEPARSRYISHKRPRKKCKPARASCMEANIESP